MAERLVGKWKCVSTENFDDFLKELDVGFMQRKAASAMKPNLTIEYDPATKAWMLTSETTLKTVKTSFKLDQEYDEDTQDGRKVKSLPTVEGAKIVQTQHTKDGKHFCTITREVNASDEQIVTFKAGDVTARRVFKRA